MGTYKLLLTHIKTKYFSRFAAGIFFVWLAVVAVSFVIAKFHYNVPFASVLSNLHSWDGVWYLQLIANGYPDLRALPPDIDQRAIAFFPLYPLLVMSLSWTLHVSPIIVGVTLSVGCFFVALQLLHYLLVTCWKIHQSTARFSLALLVFNPFSLYFGMLYTESLFLLLSTLVFILLYKRHYLASAIVTGLASGTRVTGVLLALVVVIAYIVTEHPRIWSCLKTYKTYLIGLVSISGLLGFMLFLWWRTGDPLAFVHVQTIFGRSFEAGGFVTEFQTIISKFGTYAARPYMLVFSIMFGLAAIISGIWLLYKKRTRAYGAFILMSTVLPLTSGTFQALNRYSMIHIGVYVFVMTFIRHRIARYVLVAISAVSLIGFIIILCDPSRSILLG